MAKHDVIDATVAEDATNGGVIVSFGIDTMPRYVTVYEYAPPFDDRRYLPVRTATRQVRTYGAIGRCNCSECKFSVEVSDAYCRECGAKFIGTDYEKVGSK